MHPPRAARLRPASKADFGEEGLHFQGDGAHVRPRDARPGIEIDAELVSQTWRGVVWRHELRVVVPSRPAASDLAVLVVGGDGAHGPIDERRLAEDTGVITSYLRSVPNQPLFGASEDALIAFSFEQYLRTNDADWPLLFPMTKAAATAS